MAHAPNKDASHKSSPRFDKLSRIPIIVLGAVEDTGSAVRLWTCVPEVPQSKSNWNGDAKMPPLGRWVVGCSHDEQ